MEQQLHAKAARRENGTRKQLLDAAGEVFAEKGYDRATAREICDRAGVNPAAVNYHFGGIDALYSEALVLAHAYIMRIETLTAIASSDGTALEKIGRIIEVMVQSLAGTAERTWQIRLCGREIVSPTPLRAALLETQIFPKIRILKQLIAEVIELDVDDDRVGRAALSVVTPCLLLAVGDPNVLRHLVPSLQNGPDEAPLLAAHLVRFATAGLRAAAAEVKSESG